MSFTKAQIKQHTASLKRGSILYWRGFRFADGTTADKLVLLLSNRIKNRCYIVALPTSQTQHYVQGKRSMIDVVCFPSTDQSWFSVDTVIDLKNCQPVEVEELLPHLLAGTATKKAELDAVSMTAIDVAVQNAATLSPKTKKLILG